MRPACQAEGTRYPILYFGPTGKPRAYKLEVPQTICDADQASFDPFTFVREKARAGMDGALGAAGKDPVDWDVIELEWGDPADAAFAEIAGGGEARLWWGE